MLQVLDDAIASTVGVIEQFALDIFVASEDAVHVGTSETIGRFSKGVQEESPDTGIPCLDPGENGSARSELLPKLGYVGINLRLIDDPGT